MEALFVFLQAHGTLGLLFLSFIESFCSPILPDILLIPMSIAQPEKALYYSFLVVIASLFGGIIGYFIGQKLGLPVFKKIVPLKHIEKLRLWTEKYGAWAVFLGAVSPIPYKVVCIGAGVFKLNFTLFLIFSFLGRAKRFLIIGLLFHFYGKEAAELINRHTDTVVWGTILMLIIIFFIYKLYQKLKSPKAK